MDKMREDFEAWAVGADLDTSCYIDNGEQGDYCDVVAQYAWLGWKASRAALCVELPENCKGMAITVDEFHAQLNKSGVSYK